MRNIFEDEKKKLYSEIRESHIYGVVENVRRKEEEKKKAKYLIYSILEDFGRGLTQENMRKIRERIQKEYNTEKEREKIRDFGNFQKNFEIEKNKARIEAQIYYADDVEDYQISYIYYFEIEGKKYFNNGCYGWESWTIEGKGFDELTEEEKKKINEVFYNDNI